MAFSDVLVAIITLLLIFFIIYTKMKNQDLRDSLNEIKELIVKHD